MHRPSRHAARFLSRLPRRHFLFRAVAGDDDSPPQPAFGQVTYVFGAIVSDTGTPATSFQRNCPPTPSLCSGRFSNGPLFAEIVAARYSAAVTTVCTGGNNFCHAGARTGPIAARSRRAELVTQLDQYFARVNFVRAERVFIVDGSPSATTSSMR